MDRARAASSPQHTVIPRPQLLSRDPATMSHSNFGRGRGFGPRGSRAIGSFGKPRFVRPPFRRGGPPPRPGCPASFGMPWQPNNMVFPPHLVHGNPQFRPGGRRRRVCGFDLRFPPPNRLLVPMDSEEIVPSSSNHPPWEDNRGSTAPQIPLPGSEEERQQKIATTADRLKQKLSCFNGNEVTSDWSGDVSLPPVAQDGGVENQSPRYEQAELGLTHNDLKDIGRINVDDSRLGMQCETDLPDFTADVSVMPREDRSDVEVTSNNPMTEVENCKEEQEAQSVCDDDCIEKEQWDPRESSIDNSHSLEQTDLLDADVNAENQLLELGVPCDNVSPINISRDQNDQQDIPQESAVRPTSGEQGAASETPISQNARPSIVSAQAPASRNDAPQRKTEAVANSEIQEKILKPRVYAKKSLPSNNSTLPQPAALNVPVLNNVALDNRLPIITESSFHSGPPRLSPHIEQELPIDFDPTTPPPMLIKQEQPVNVLPPMLIHDRSTTHLPPLFNPTEPPPNMRLGPIKMPHESPAPPWNINAQNQVPAGYNTEVHMDRSPHVGFTPQQLPLEMPSQSNIFLAPPIDPMNFSPLYPMPPGSHSVINTNVPLLPQGQIVPHSGPCVPPPSSSSSSSPQELLPFSDCTVNKDDVLNDMQEAMKFAQEMTSITETSIAENVTESVTGKYDGKSRRPDPTPLTKRRTSANPAGNVEYISLPPGKPKVKPVKLKRTKRDYTQNERFKVPEELRASDNALLSGVIIVQDDVSVKTRDVPIVNEQDRPKVVFNLNNKTIKVKSKTAWQGDTRKRKHEKKKNGMTRLARSEMMHATASAITKNLADIPRQDEEERIVFKRNLNNASKTIPSEPMAIQAAPSPSRRKIQRVPGPHREKFQRPGVSAYPRANAQRAQRTQKVRVKRNQTASSEISWKNNVISRFLKMSRNDIYNMVNNTSLRKFDVIMKRLVKEQKPTLSLEMRQVQDEKMRLYDQQEFMKQLNAMLDTETTVSVTDLPTEFIHHLNEVLQLDVQPDNDPGELPPTALPSQSDHSLEDTSHVLDPATYIAEYETADVTSEECVRNRSQVMCRSPCDQDLQTYNRNNNFDVKDDTSSTVMSNKSNLSNKMSALQHDLDDIFSEVTKKNHAPTAVMRKACVAGQRNAKRLDEDACVGTKNLQREAFLEDDRARRSENCARWIEKCDKWKKKEREDPYTYRNLTKEEWEAKYGTQANVMAASSSALPAAPLSSFAITLPAPSAPSAKAINTCLTNQLLDEESYPQRRHSSESSRHSSTRQRSAEKGKHKRCKQDSDDRRHGVEYTEDKSNSSDSESDSDSSSSNNNNTSSNSNDTEPNVTKLLRAIKENEKVAKKMSLNESIRDEVNAEIERERKQKSKKSRKNRKNAKRKAKRVHHKKKKKQSKREESTFSDSPSDKDNSEEAMRLLTEREIKKEIMEREQEIQQEVIIKEELDIGQEEIVGEAELANVSNRILESHEGLASPLASQETSVTSAGSAAVRSYSSEDKQSTASSMQPKTKAQLKQMPSDMNDNKVPLSVFTAIPESMIAETFGQTHEAMLDALNCQQNTTAKVSLPINTLTRCSDLTDGTVHASHDRPNESTKLPETNATAPTLAHSSAINTQNELSPNASNVPSKAPLVSDTTSTPNAAAAPQKQGPSKKIDIKTYYERNIQRRMNKQEGPKRPMENPPNPPKIQDSSSMHKSTEPETMINRPALFASLYGSSVQDPRLVSAARLAAVSGSMMNSKDNTAAQAIPGKNTQQGQKRGKGPELTLKHAKEDPNRIVQTDNAVKKIDQHKSEEKTMFAAKTSTNPLSNVAAKFKATPSRLKRYSQVEAKVTPQTLQQAKVAHDPNKFKNIRSEGSKELKLRKEKAKALRTKKKSTVTLKPDPDKGLGSTIIRSSLEDTAKMESKKRLEPIERKSIEETASSSDAHEQSTSKLTLDDTRDAAAAVEMEMEIKKDLAADEISVCKLDVSTPPETVPEAEAEVEVSDDNERNKADFFVPSETQSCDATTDTKLAGLNPEGQSEQSHKDLTASTNVPASLADVSSISESDNVGAQGKDIQLSISTHAISNTGTNNDTNENHAGSDILANAYETASAEEDASALKKTAVEPPSASNENSEEQPATMEVVTSSESLGSPFKGFLQESIIAFGQPNLFNIELNETDGGKKIKLLVDGCNVNYVAHVSCVNDVTHGAYKEMEIERGHYETLDSVPDPDHVNDTSLNTNQTFNIAFTSPLFTLDKGPADDDRPNMTNCNVTIPTDESGEGHIGRSSASEATVLRDDNDDNVHVGIDKDSEPEEQLGNGKDYLNAELAMKESIFIINEEEIIHEETRPEDLTDKLTTTTDPSLSDAVDTAISDDPLRLPDSQGAEHLSNHVYLETNLSAEKTSCDKLADFESDEHLVNDMFYLDDRLQAAAEFDHKDDTPSHFSIHQSPRYDITPTVTPETTMIAPPDEADLPHVETRKSEQCEFNFKHISSVDNECNLLARAPPLSPLRTDARRTLNVPTKAALKEAATDLFFKSPANTSMATTSEELTLRMLDTSQQSEADLNYHMSVWRADLAHDHNEGTHVAGTPKQDHSVNVNAISSTQNNASEPYSYDEADAAAQQRSLTFVGIEKQYPYNIQRNPVMELRKLRELDGALNNETRKASERLGDMGYRGQKKRKDTILHKIKDKGSVKYRFGKNKGSLTRRLRGLMEQSGSFGGDKREAILARMLEIDLEMHKLTVEKLKLHEMLRNDTSSDNLTPGTNAEPRTTDNDDQRPVPVQPATSPTLPSTSNTETSRAFERDKHALSLKRSLTKQRKRTASAVNSEDNEIKPSHTQRSKTPVIKWKKKPRLELAPKRKESEERQDGEEDDQRTTKQISPSASRKADGLIEAFPVENVVEKRGELDSQDEPRQHGTNSAKSNNNCRTDPGDADKSAKHAICSDENASQRNLEAPSGSCQNSAEQEVAERAGGFDVDKRNDVPTSGETVRASSQPRCTQLQSTLERLSIYSDDSTWDDLVQNTALDVHERRRSTGLALLDEALKKQQATTRKLKAMARKKKKQQLHNFLKSVDILTLEEEELPLSKLYIRKLQQKRDLLDSLSQRKEDASAVLDPKTLRNVDEVINAVAQNRVRDLYGQHSLEASNDNNIVATTSHSDKHKFYVDVEANANSDWACQEKENIEQVVLQQDINDLSIADASNHVFKVVSQNEASAFCDEHNVEPDSSVTPEATLMENHSLDGERVGPKDLGNTASRSFDIKVSVPKTLIKDEFSLELLQKLKDTEVTVVGTGQVDSTTNTFSASTENQPEKPGKENNQDSHCDDSLIAKLSPARDVDQLEDTTKSVEGDESAAVDACDDKSKSCESQKQEETTVDNVENAQTDTAKPGYSDITGSEDSGDSVGSNQYDKMTDMVQDSNTSDLITDRADSKEEKPKSAEPEYHAVAVRTQDCQDAGNATTIAKEERGHPRVKSRSHMSDESLSNDRSTGDTTPADRMSDKSEESNETLVNPQKSEHSSTTSTTSTSLFFDRITERSREPTKKLRMSRKSDKLTPIRRSTRYSSGPKSSKIKIKETDANSNGSESSSFHEVDPTARRGSRSPMGMQPDEKGNIRKSRVTQKEQNTSGSRKLLTAVAESAVTRTARKRKHTMWQMLNCKVRVIDCKHKSDVHSEVVGTVEANTIEPADVASDVSYVQHVAYDRDLAITFVAVPPETSCSSPDRKSCDKDKTEIEILEEKPFQASNDGDLAYEFVSHDVTETDELESTRTQYTVHKGPILDIKVFGSSFLAASEDGKIYRYSQTSNGILNIYKGHKSAVTCLHVYKSEVAGVKKEHMYSGSLDGTLRCYNVMTGGLVKSPAQVNSPIQCMDQAWGMIFVGTKSGHVSRFYIKGGIIKGSNIQFSDNSVLALKATNEGPRKILIVASRSQPITIRDATTGLFLRTISSQHNHTVYSLMRHHSLIYCGTSSTSINVFDFTTGEQRIQYAAGVGIVCMRLYDQLLFAGCYDGNIYVFDTNNRELVCSIRGPGNMLLSLEVVNNKIIAGTKDKRLHAWQMPSQVRALLQKKIS